MSDKTKGERGGGEAGASGGWGVECHRNNGIYIPRKEKVAWVPP